MGLFKPKSKIAPKEQEKTYLSDLQEEEEQEQEEIQSSTTEQIKEETKSFAERIRKTDNWALEEVATQTTIVIKNGATGERYTESAALVKILNNQEAMLKILKKLEEI